MRPRSLPSLIAVWAFAACGSSSVARPDDTIDAYVRAVANEDWRAVYDLLDPDVHGGATRDEFVAWCREHTVALQAQADALGAARRMRQAETVAELPLDRVRTIELVHEEGAWRLRDHAPLLQGGDTPDEALASLALLVRSDELDALLGALSQGLRAQYTAELELVAEALERGATAELSVQGEHATVEIGDVTIRMVREDGAWRVSGLEQPYVYPNYYDYMY